MRPKSSSANGNHRTLYKPDSPETQVDLLRYLRETITQFLEIHTEQHLQTNELPPEDRAIIARREASHPLITFDGRLKFDSEQTYAQLDAILSTMDLYAIFRSNSAQESSAPHRVHIVYGRPKRSQSSASIPWLNIVLFVATVMSLLLTGTMIAIGEIGIEDPAQAELIRSSLGNTLREMWRGWPYALSLLLILVPHEMGHYLTTRYYKASASLPYFLPAFLISPFGTFGAAIILRDSLRNRKWLLDLGASGPIAGFIFAVPVLFIGLATSPLLPIQPGGFVEGNSILYALAKLIIFGEVLPNGEVDVFVNQLAWAGWTGLFVTALNMIPLGQLDGGHILYALLGNRARLLYWPLMGAMLGLTLFVSQVWLFFAVILLLVGRYYAVPLDNITPLGAKRRWTGYVALVIFILSFTPIPLAEQGELSGVLQSFLSIQPLSLMATVTLLSLNFRSRCGHHTNVP